MEDTLQELEFLDLGGLSEDEKCCLQSYLDGPLSPKPSQNTLKSNQEIPEQPGNDAEMPTQSCATPVFQNAPVDHMTVPITVGHPALGPMHVYQPNMCIASTLSQYQQMSYPIPMLSGPHLMGANYFMSPPNPAIPHPGTFPPQPHQILNQQPFPRKGKSPRAKYSPRKELQNGHSEGFGGVVFPAHGSYPGAFFPGNLVQAATGMPIVMHQSVPSYVPPQNVHLTTATPAPIYPVASFTPNVVSVSQSENAVAASVPTPVAELNDHPVEPVPPFSTDAVQTAPRETTKQAEMPLAIPTKPNALPTNPEIVASPSLPETSQSGKSWASLVRHQGQDVAATEKPVVEFAGSESPSHGSCNGSSLTESMVHAATGIPIVMHQPTSPSIPLQDTLQTTTPAPAQSVTAPSSTAPPVAQSKKAAGIEVKEQTVKSTPPTTIETTSKEAKKPKPESFTASSAQLGHVPAKTAKVMAPAPSESSSGKTWASLFGKTAGNATVAEKPTARVEPFTSANNAATTQAVSPSATPALDPHLKRLAQHLTKYELHQTPVALLPRGLINKGNWCYINATLQALVACSPFVHLMKSLVPFVRSKSAESTPITESVLEFIEQFETVPIKSVKDRQAAKKEDPNIGISFEPTSIYKALSKIRSETFKVEGRQEDAEEFLSCLLNALHDEMIELMRSSMNHLKPAELKQNGQEQDDDWQVIGPKNRGCVTHTTAFSKTPISNLFLGQMRSALHYAGAQSTATLQPFFSLQLDIQNEKVNSVRDALACLVSKEPLTGYVCSKTGQEVEASRQITLEELPPILILHLKCFVYDKSGGIQKLMKRVDFTSDLELSKEFLSPSQKGKLKEGQRKYKLFAVVYHDGKEATKGHYITEVHHAGVGGWLRFDDSIVRVVDSQLFKYNLPRMPYLLLYRKLNL